MLKFQPSRILRRLLQVTKLASTYFPTDGTVADTLTCTLKDAAGKVATDPAIIVFPGGDLTGGNALAATSGAIVSQTPLGAVGAIVVATPDATTGILTLGSANIGNTTATIFYRNTKTSVAIAN
jgi:hypothetical protein